MQVAIETLADGFDRWEDVLDLMRRSFAYMDGVIDPPSSVHRLSAADLADKSRHETALAAFVDGVLAGCAFVLERVDDCYVGKIAVDPALQGLGIGRRLLAAAEDIARHRGKLALELQTRVELVGNHAAFGRLGFREIARTAHPGFGRPTSITLRKQLA